MSLIEPIDRADDADQLDDDSPPFPFPAAIPLRVPPGFLDFTWQPVAGLTARAAKWQADTKAGGQ